MSTVQPTWLFDIIAMTMMHSLKRCYKKLVADPTIVSKFTLKMGCFALITVSMWGRTLNCMTCSFRLSMLPHWVATLVFLWCTEEFTNSSVGLAWSLLRKKLRNTSWPVSKPSLNEFLTRGSYNHCPFQTYLGRWSPWILSWASIPLDTTTPFSWWSINCLSTCTLFPCTIHLQPKW